jgi:UDP-2,3-diacylglucosamine hydrolase
VTGHVVSDLHLFTWRSYAGRLASDLRETAAKSDFFVLNGDIFDFWWSVYPDPDRTASEAIQWLSDLAESAPQCRVCYVMGNHDNMRVMETPLDDLAAGLSNFEWDRAFLKIGSALFLHGDMRAQGPLERELREQVWRRGRLLASLYLAGVVLHLHRLADPFKSRKKHSRRLLDFLESGEENFLDGVTDIYFGHTHIPFRDLELGGYRFHNSGSAIINKRCDIIEVTC